ncbi:MAG TPA: STAS/SEC14 domain-containing protein [Solirubrobacterales bacterium]|nr:STAS/SEC14 domain-containing protein [Solirubrobacterales bacterium]
MIEAIEDTPARVIGFRVTGEMTEADYQEVLAPAMKAAAADGQVRLLLVGANGFDLGSLKARFEAARNDPELDLGHGKDWRRVAVVAEANFFIRQLFPGIAKLIPVEVKLFDPKDEAEARTWVAA